MRRSFLLAVVGLPLVVHAAGDWDDFSNNLATDLAPFLSLFGEQVTKQYLSESTTFLDYFIFAMAPMGILTAVVSAIRVCGSPALRAFVGRAQEGAGQAEAELCSSTSQDVCELYHKGGIARVFGRPKLLEFVYHPDNDLNGEPEILSFREHVRIGGSWKRKDKRSWLKKRLAVWSDLVSAAENAHDPDLPAPVFAPSLSLNIGIKKQPPAVFRAVALGGFSLQAGVVVFAVLVTYHLQWAVDGDRAGSYACPLMIAGTVFVCAGMFVCAFLVGESTEEQVWATRRRNRASIHWLQPGGQTIGDQTFSAFYYTDTSLQNGVREYTISWKKKRSKAAERGVWVAVSITMLGFVLQFIGLRGIHPAVAVAQLGAVMVMSLARAALRMQRLKPEDNELASQGEILRGHELDWLALRLGRQHVREYLATTCTQPQLPPGKLPSIEIQWRFCCAPCPTERITPLVHPCHPDRSDPTIAERLIGLRSKLTDFTMPPAIDTSVSMPTFVFDSNMMKVRQSAKHLVMAIGSVATVIFEDRAEVKLNSNYDSVGCFQWSFGTKVVVTQRRETGEAESSADPPELQDPLSVVLAKIPNHSELWRWILIPDPVVTMESVLSLWAWGLKCDSEGRKGSSREIVSGRSARARARQCYGMVYTRGYDAPLIPYFWGVETMVNKDFKQYKFDVPERPDPGTIWQLDKSEDPRVQIQQSKQFVEGDGTFVRLLGWYAFPASQPLIEGLVGTALVLSDRPSPSLLAHEILGTFLMGALSVVEDIGPIRLEEQGKGFCLTNRLIISLVKAYTDSDLGSEQDALACILPAVLSQLKTPSLQFAIESAKQLAREWRLDHKWSDASRILSWVLRKAQEFAPSKSDSVTSDLEMWEQMFIDIVTVHCELYRYALRDPNHYRFGFNGLQDLRKNLPLSVIPIVKHYIEAAHRFDPLSVTDDCDGLLSALNTKDLTATLVELTRLRPSGGASIPDRTIGDALCVAARLGWAEVVLALLELGANPAYDGLEPSASRTALSYAAENGSIHIVNYLLDWGADLSAVDTTSNLPIHYAARKGHARVVRRLLGITNTMAGKNDIMLAVSLGDTKIVDFLLSTGVDIQTRGRASRTPLHEAVAQNDIPMIKLLLEKGADIDAKDYHGETPLKLVERNQSLKPFQHAEIADILKAHERRRPASSSLSSPTP